MIVEQGFLGYVLFGKEGGDDVVVDGLDVGVAGQEIGEFTECVGVIEDGMVAETPGAGVE